MATKRYMKYSPIGHVSLSIYIYLCTLDLDQVRSPDRLVIDPHRRDLNHGNDIPNYSL